MANAPSSSPPHVPVPVSIIETYSLINDGPINENGHSWSPSNGQPRLSAFVVRLTDASLKALNQAVAEARQKKTKVNNGYVELGPSKNSSSDGTLCFGGSSSVVHRFSLTDAQRDLGPKGQLEAIEQERNSGNEQKFGKSLSSSSCRGKMRSIGPVNHRLQISATTEDTFESTKQKAQQASDEQKRNAAKVVMKGPAVGSGATKVWAKINKAQASTSQRPLTPLSHQKATNKLTSNNNHSNGNNGNNGDVAKRPLRQRILYKLFLTSMSPVELLSKLTSEGISDQDKINFDRTLNEVAQAIRGPMSDSSTSDALSNYEVKRTCYSEIRLDDWPFYNNWEKQTCRKKLLMVKNPPPPGQHHSSQTTNGATNSDDTTQRVSGKISYRPPPKKPPTSSSPPRVTLSKSPPIAPASILPSPPRAAPTPTTTTASPLPTSATTATTNGSINHNNSDDTTQRVSAKIGYRPPPKKPAANSPQNSSIGNGKSPPIPPSSTLCSPPRSIPITTTSTSSPSAATTNAYSPPPKKKAHHDSSMVNGDSHSNSAGNSNSNTNSRSTRPTSPLETNGIANGHHHRDFEEDTNLRRKRRQQHQQRPALGVSTNNNHNHGNGSSTFNSAAPPRAPTPAPPPAPTPTPTPTPAPLPPPPPQSSSDSYNGNNNNNNGPSIIDYRLEYPSIGSADDRRKYKDDFDREYPTYLKLYERLRSTASDFEKLGDKLKRTKKETQEYEDIEKEIFYKYRQFQQDAEIHRSRREHERLRKKLGVIKDRVKEYDDRQLGNLSTMNNGDW